PASRQSAYQCLHGRDPGRPPDEDDLINIVGGDLRVLHGLLDRSHAALDQVRSELVESRPHEIDVKVLWSRSLFRDERQVYRGLANSRQLDLGLLRSLEQPLQCLRIVSQI